MADFIKDNMPYSVIIIVAAVLAVLMFIVLIIAATTQKKKVKKRIHPASRKKQPKSRDRKSVV